VDEQNPFGNPEFIKGPKSNKDAFSRMDPSQLPTASLSRSDLSDLLADLSAQNAGEEFLLDRELEQACLATGATGAAIALVRGDKIVCHATAGPHAPDIGVCLDPDHGLSGACIQSRSLQQCNDTETDSRVDPEASRNLGVRSIVVLPLIERDKLFGIFEVLSSRPNAFDQRHLDTLQALTDRIVRGRSQNWEATAAEAPKQSALVAPKGEEIISSPPAKLQPVIPRRARSSKTDLWAATLGLLVIAVALLLGTLVGWRQGWQEATSALRASSPRLRASASATPAQTGRTLPSNVPTSGSVANDECGQSGAAGPSTQPPSGGLTVCQDGQVIFRQSASAPPPTPELRTARNPRGLQTDPQRR
jgi:GAF domain